MATFYTIDRANERLVELRPILEDLRARRLELIELRDRLRASRVADQRSSNRTLVDDALTGAGDGGGTPRVLTARMQAVIDQMQAAVTRLDDWGITLRDIQTGLVDFPALVAGRQVWLCWHLAEEQVAWWHEMATGIEGRRALADLE